MQEMIQELQALYEPLKASPVGAHITKIGWGKWPGVLSVRNAWGEERNDMIVYINLDQAPGTFKYHALSNKGMNNPEHYLTLEEKRESLPILFWR